MTVKLSATEIRAQSYLLTIEQDIVALLAARPMDMPAGQELLGLVERRLNQIVNYSWALRTFPLFDPLCLSRMQKEKITVDGASYDLWVPTFVADDGRHDVEWWPTAYDRKVPGFWYPSVYLDDNKMQENQRLRTQNSRLMLRTRAPHLPASVTRRVNRVREKFDAVFTVFEAEWKPRVIKDPLVIGRVMDCDFVIDEFDLTKLERYIAAEYCQKPKN